MAFCIWTSIVKYLKEKTDSRQYLTPDAGSELYSAVCNVFGWMAIRQDTVTAESAANWVQWVTYSQTVEATVSRRSLSICCLDKSRFPHDCSSMKVRKAGAGLPGPGTKMAKKMVVDYWRDLQRYLICTQAGPEEAIADTNADVEVKAENTTIAGGQDVTVSKSVEPAPPALEDVANTGKDYEFDSLLNREIQIADVDLSTVKEWTSVDWILPADILKADCVPNMLPMESLVYGAYDLEILIKINAHKFTSGVFHMSVVPDPVLLNSYYEWLNPTLQRHGIFLDLSQSPTGTLSIPWEFRKTFVHNIAVGNEALGVTPATYAKVKLYNVIPPASGTSMDVAAHALVFVRFKKARMAGMAMRMPVTQGPVRTFVQPFRDFASYVHRADQVLGDALDFMGADKPPNITEISHVVPKARAFFPNSRGMSDATVMRTDPSGTMVCRTGVNKGDVSTLQDVMSIWGFLSKIEWSVNDEQGKELLRIPLDPAYFLTGDENNVKVATITSPPPISYIVRLAALWTGPIQFDIMFAGTDFHSGSLTFSYEFGRSSATAEKGHCQPFSYQYDVHDLGEKRRFTVEVPYIYDTPWRRVPTQGPMCTDQLYRGGPMDPPAEAAGAVRMRNEAYLVIRVANKLKAASTVTNTLNGIVRVRAGNNFRIRGLVPLSGSIEAPLGMPHNASYKDRMKAIEEWTSLKYVPLDSTEDWHSSIRHYRPVSKMRGGDYLLTVKNSVTLDAAKYKELEESRIRVDQLESEKDSLAAQLVVARQGLQIKHQEVIQADDSRCESELALREDQLANTQLELERTKLEIEALNAFFNAPIRVDPKDAGGDTSVVEKEVIKGKVLMQRLKNGHWVPVHSAAWWQAASEQGGLRRHIKWELRPTSQAPLKEMLPTEIKSIKSVDPLSVLSVGEELRLIDVLRRPVHLYRAVKVPAHLSPGDMSDPKSAKNSDIFRNWTIPLVPPQFTLCTPAHVGDFFFSNGPLRSPASMIMSLFRHWSGSMEYTFCFYGAKDRDVPIYIVYVPHDGLLSYGDTANFNVAGTPYNQVIGAPSSLGSDPSTYMHGGIESLGYATEVVIPSVNPTATVAVPYYTQSVLTPCNSDFIDKAGPARDRTDNMAGKLIVVSRQEVRMDVWWSAGVDFMPHTFLGTPRLLVSGTTMPADDNRPLFRLKAVSGSVPTIALEIPETQMWSVVTSLATSASAVTSMLILKPVYRMVESFSEVSAAMVRSASSVSRTSAKVEHIAGLVEGALVHGTESLDTVVEKVDVYMANYFPMVKNSALVVTAVLDVWMLTQSQDVSVVVNVVVRWLMNAGLVTMQGLTSVAAKATKVFTGIFRTHTQAWMTETAMYLRSLILALDCFRGVSITKEFLRFLDDVLLNHRIMKIVWSGRIIAALCDFIRMLYSLIKRFFYWLRGSKDPQARMYYMLADRNKDLDRLVTKIHKYMSADVQRLLRVSPKARIDFYALYVVVLKVERVMIAAPRQDQNPHLMSLIGTFKKKAFELSQKLYTAPVKYEPFMVQMYGQTNIGKSYVSTHVIDMYLEVAGVQCRGKPTITRTPGQEFWTDVDGVEAAVLVDEAGHLNTEEDNRGFVADTFMMKSPASLNPNQASEDKKDRCINPVVAVFLSNDPNPHMNEVRCKEAFQRRFDWTIEVRKVDGVAMDSTFKHLQFRPVKCRGQLVGGHWMSADDFRVWFKEQAEVYHNREVKNVEHRTRELMKSVGLEDEWELLLKDPWSIYFKHLYGVSSRGDEKDTHKMMESVFTAWLEETGATSDLDYVLSQANVTDGSKVLCDDVPLRRYVAGKLAEYRSVLRHFQQDEERVRDMVQCLEHRILTLLDADLSVAPGFVTVQTFKELLLVRDAMELKWNEYAQSCAAVVGYFQEQYSGIKEVAYREVYDRAVKVMSKAALEPVVGGESWESVVLLMTTAETAFQKALKDYLAIDLSMVVDDLAADFASKKIKTEIPVVRKFKDKSLVKSIVKTVTVFSGICGEQEDALIEYVTRSVRSDADAVARGGEVLFCNMERVKEEVKKPRTRAEIIAYLNAHPDDHEAWNKFRREHGKGQDPNSTQDTPLYGRVRTFYNPNNGFPRGTPEELAKLLGDLALDQQEGLPPDAFMLLSIVMQYSFAEMATNFCDRIGLECGDCDRCGDDCVAVLRPCEHETCEREYVCYRCLLDQPDAMSCAKCTRVVVNPLTRKTVGQWLMNMLAPIASVASVPLMSLVHGFFSFLSAHHTWMKESTRVYWTATIVQLCLANVWVTTAYTTYLAYKWWTTVSHGRVYKFSRNMLGCHLYHSVRAGTKMVKNAGLYVCRKCWRAPEEIPQSQSILEDMEFTLEQRLATIQPEEYDLGERRIASKLGRSCAHLDLYEEVTTENLIGGHYLDGDRAYKVPTAVEFHNGRWVVYDITATIEVENVYCGEKCVLREKEQVNHLLASFITYNDARTISDAISCGEGKGVPIQLIPMVQRKKGFFGKVVALRDYLLSFRNSEWWKWVTDKGLKVLAKIAAVTMFVLMLGAALYKLYRMVFGKKDEGVLEPDEEVIQAEEVIGLAQMASASAGGSMPRQKHTRIARLRRPTTQMSGGMGLNSIMAAVLQNQMIMTVKGRDGVDTKLAGLAVLERYAIMPKHYKPKLENAVEAGISIAFMCSSMVVNYTYSADDFQCDAESDLMMMRLPPSVTLRKDIRKHFRSVDQYERTALSSRGYIAIPPVGGLPAYTLHKINMGERYDTLGVHDGESGMTVQLLDSVSYNFSMNGACGSVIYQDLPNQPIVGIHVAGSGQYMDGKGYGLIISVELLEDLLKRFTTRPVVQMASCPFQPLDGVQAHLVDANVEFIGAIPDNLKCTQPAKTHIVENVLNTYLHIEPVRVPVPLGPNDGPYAGIEDTPLHAGVRNMGCEVLDIPTDEVQVAGEALMQKVRQMTPLVASPSPLTIEQAVVGLEQDYYDPVDLSTSAGFPYCKEQSDGSKRPWIQVDDSKNVTVHERVREDISRKSLARQQGEVQWTVFADIMKDERKKKDSLLKVGKTRIISMSPLDFTLTIRMYFLHFMAAFMAQRNKLHHAVGIAPDGPEWTHLYSRLKQKNASCVWTIDYTNFGPGFSARASAKCYSIISRWTKERVRLTEGQKREVDVIVEELINSVHVYDRVVYRQGCGSPSGAAITVIINTLVNLFYILWAFKRIAKREQRLALLVRERGLMAAFEEVAEYVAYGDDGIGTTKPEYVAVLNAATISNELASIKVVATDSAKGTVVKATVPWEQAEFLKRGFQPHPQRRGFYLAPLPAYIVEETAIYSHSSADDMAMVAQVISASLLNAYGRGPEYYEQWYIRLAQAAGSVGVEMPHWSWLDLDNLFFAEGTYTQASRALRVGHPYEYVVVEDAIVLDPGSVPAICEDVEELVVTVSPEPKSPGRAVRGKAAVENMLPAFMQGQRVLGKSSPRLKPAVRAVLGHN